MRQFHPDYNAAKTIQEKSWMVRQDCWTAFCIGVIHGLGGDYPIRKQRYKSINQAFYRGFDMAKEAR